MSRTNSIYTTDESSYGGFPASDWRTVPKETWSCSDWVEYHKVLKKSIGKHHSLVNWVTAWQAFGSGVRGDECKGKTDFYNYFMEQGIDIDPSTLQWLKHKSSNFIGGIENFIKYGLYGVGGIVLLIIIALVWSMVRNPQAWKSGATMVATRGLMK